MGLFLATSGIVCPDSKAVQDALTAYIDSTGGAFELRAASLEKGGIGVIHSNDSTTTIVWPDGFTEWDDVSKFLSQELMTPVFSFHIHDGDLWMFVAFREGNEVAWYNPIPDYWGEIDDSERVRWAGDANVVASLVSGATPQAIERYLVPWTDEALGDANKAYDDDEFTIGTDWQITDFMKRLGFDYPIDDSGEPIGETFYVKIRRKKPLPQTESPSSTLHESPPAGNKKTNKPWWKFW